MESTTYKEFEIFVGAKMRENLDKQEFFHA